MRDPRVDQVAHTLVHYSTELRPGEKVLIQGPELAQPLALAVYREALLAGALPVLWSTFDEAAQIFFEHADEAQLAWENPILIEAARSVDAYISLRAPTNLRMLSNVEAAKQVAAQKARRAFLDVVLKKRWVICELPTPALAQEAGMSLAELEQFSFGAVSIDWPAMRDELTLCGSVSSKLAVRCASSLRAPTCGSSWPAVPGWPTTASTTCRAERYSRVQSKIASKARSPTSTRRRTTAAR